MRTRADLNLFLLHSNSVDLTVDPRQPRVHRCFLLGWLGTLVHEPFVHVLDVAARSVFVGPIRGHVVPVRSISGSTIFRLG
jgi:hypothetical protein